MGESHAPRVRGTPSRVLMLGVLIGASACGSTGPTGGGGGSRNEITAEQIAALPTGIGTAYDIIAQLNPRWLRASRSQGTPGSGPALPAVFMDRQSLGDIESLTGIPVQEVERIEYLDMRDATIQFGTGYPGGIIRVVSRRGR